MPTLDWIGKKSVVNHHREVPYRLLHCDKSKSVGDPDAGNLLVQGDNLEALKALLPYYAGKVKCIYIDPPYNTGNEGWVYNDNVNSTEMREWLGKAVGKEAEDLSRHDKWLCMMYPRLRLLKDFLSEDGAIFVSIDVNEMHSAKFLLDEIFGSNCHKNTIAVRRGIKSVQSQFDDIDSLYQGHEYILFYTKNKDVRLPKLSLKHESEKPGKWDTFWRGTDRHTMRYEILGKTPETGQWRWERSRAYKALNNYLEYEESHSRDMSLDEWFTDNLTSKNEKMDFVRASEDGTVQYYVPPSGQKLLSDNWMDILLSGSETAFETEKNKLLIRRIIDWLTEGDDIIMDSFAGSGTSAHALLEANGADLGQRKFILIEMISPIVENIVLPRLHKVIEKHKIEKRIDSGFRFCTLGEPLFDAEGSVNREVTFPDLAAHVFFCETGSPIPKRVSDTNPFIGTFKGRAVYLLHAAESVGVASTRAGNVLTAAKLAKLPLPKPSFTGPRVVYAEGCTVPDDRLNALGVTFKQIPYQIEGL